MSAVLAKVKEEQKENIKVVQGRLFNLFMKRR